MPDEAGLDWYWIDGEFFTAGVGVTRESVGVRAGVIVRTAPILRRFLGQTIEDLSTWSPVREVRRIEDEKT
jgi:hypothetical protein